MIDMTNRDDRSLYGICEDNEKRFVDWVSVLGFVGGRLEGKEFTLHE